MSTQASIHINTDDVIGEVHDYLYGANLEHIGQSIYGGIWAEMLRDRKFAGHDWMYAGNSEGLHNVNSNIGVVVPWEAVNPNYETVLFVHDNTAFYTGQQSQRITIRQSDSEAHGIQQSGLSLRANTSYDIRLVLKGETQRVTVTLGEQLWEIESVAEDWATYETTLTIRNSDPNGSLTITTKETGNLWIGCASVMPSNHLSGFRADVIEALRDWQPTFLRWSGGNFVSAYHWQNGIGDRDKRPSYLDPVWHHWESNDVGTDEFLTLCDLVECDALLTINMGTGTSEEARAWVEYCNGGVDTEYGAMRASNGHPEPYHIKTWFVGNEQFGNWQVGHVDAETYAHRYLEFARAMRTVDSDLELIAVGVPTDLYAHWNERVLAIAGDEIDQLSVHYYSIRTEKWETPPSPEHLYLPKIGASCEVEQMLDETISIVKEKSRHEIAIAFDEWNTYCGAKAPDYIEDYNLADALYAGGVMNACINRCDVIKMSAVFNLINVMGSYRVYPQYGWQAVNLGRGGAWVATTIDKMQAEPRTVKMPATLVMELMTHYRGEVALGTDINCEAMSTPSAGNLPALDKVPIIDVATTFDSDKKQYYLSVINRHTNDDVHLIVSGLDDVEQIRQLTITGESPLSTNTYDDPDSIVIEEHSITLDAITIPRHSFCMLVFTVSK
ncbi:MAG: alpha-L-arabinofuranosidase C-terminal domain-containing protein [Chloroflexota bacterium]